MNPYNQYQTNSVMTASPAELTLMLYNGAIKFVNLGMEEVDKGNDERRNYYLLRAQDIITELQSTLDMKVEVAKEFDTFYTYINKLLKDGNVKKDKIKLEEAKELIVNFRDLWKDVMNRVK